MTQTTSLTVNETRATRPEDVSTVQSKSTTLRESVRESLQQYFVRLEEQQPANLYDLVLAEMESPLLEMVLQHTGQNQCTAARLLDISRGTLRKKMKRYGFLNRKKKLNQPYK